MKTQTTFNKVSQFKEIIFKHLYIHIPFCNGKCHYCGFYSVMSTPALIEGFTRLPGAEIDTLLQLQIITKGQPLRTLYLGGGTPSALKPAALKQLITRVAKSVDLSQLEEFSVELNPASTTRTLLKTLFSIGVTRLSIGAQIFDDTVLQDLGRKHNTAQTLKAVQMAKEVGFLNIGIDLIAGLPNITPLQWGQSLEKALHLELQHLSVYTLSVEPGTVLSHQVADGLKLPDPESQVNAISQAEKTLQHAGFERYEISNYALPGFECQHNLAIWRGADYLGLGPAAASRIGQQRWTNSPDLAEYMDAVNHNLRPVCEKDLLSKTNNELERAIFALRLTEGIDLKEIQTRFPSLRQKNVQWEKTLKALSTKQITQFKKERWQLTSRGREVCDAVLRELI